MASNGKVLFLNGPRELELGFLSQPPGHLFLPPPLLPPMKEESHRVVASLGDSDSPHLDFWEAYDIGKNESAEESSEMQPLCPESPTPSDL